MPNYSSFMVEFTVKTCCCCCQQCKRWWIMTHVCGMMFAIQRSCHSAAVTFINKPAFLQKVETMGNINKGRGENVRQINMPVLREKGSERASGRTGRRVKKKKKKKCTELAMWGRSSYMSADIQERWMRHKAPLLEGRTRGRSSCPPGQAAIRLPPSCQGLEKWPIHTQDIGSVFKDRQDTGARNTYTGRCVFLTTRDTHWRTFRRESKNTLKKKKKHTHTSMLFISLTTVSRFINH